MKKLYLSFIFIILLASFSSAAELEKSYMCEKMYESILLKIPNDQVSREILWEKKIGLSESDIQFYRENFDAICLNLINKTTHSEELCEKIYFTIIRTEWNYTESDLKHISEETGFKTPVVQNYIYNNYELCYLQGHSRELPKQNFPRLIIDNNVYCDLELNSFFYSFDIPEFYLGEIECKNAQFWNKFFRLEEFNKNFRITGIRIYWILILLAIGGFFLIFGIIKSNKKLNKILEEN